MHLKKFLLAAALSLAGSCAAADLKALADYAGIRTADLNQALAQAVFQPQIIATMTKPYEAKPWWQYRKFFITTSRIQAGVNFYLAHEQTLRRAEQIYGVPPEIICAIIGVETFYGRNMGNWRVLDALYTLGFNYPPREAYFSKEFAKFTALSLRENWDPSSVKGSYAGAMGLGQFMPSSYWSYAVDFDNDGKVNLFTDFEDAIGSVANYFKEHGWQAGHGIFYPALARLNPAALIAKEWQLDTKTAYAGGISTKVNLSQQKIRLFAFDLAGGKTGYGVGLHNFGVIMRYNKSPLYSRAVYELSEFIRNGYDRAKLQQGIIEPPEGRLP